ncbi:hypothetical protein JM16_003327 [Phytophthora kernoviae]|uniref:FH2 domain-containing protein n=1 Tax=Phytophthora kernoviae TaxID=325452 RepID=A0A8T0M260_9STRA|nr:hypothetical protein JM16_003327 [Phytophthora kernoviae]
MGNSNSASCPVYDGPVGNFVRADSDALEFDCGACPQQAVTLAVTSESWLIFHLLLSFVLVAYVRWSRVEIHNHACNQYELPPCCQQHLQQHQAQHKDVVEEKHNVVEVDVKENEVLLPTTATPMQTPEEEHAAARLETLRVEYASYLQMLKFRFPRVVVDHKMRADGKNPKVLDELIAVSSTAPKEKKLPGPIAIPPAAEPVEDAEHTQKIEAFQRMLKVGVPRHLVEMKARKEGVDPAELNGSAVRATPTEEEADDSKLNSGVLLAPSSLATRSRRSSISSSVSTAPSTPDALAMRSAVATGNGRHLAMMALRKMNAGMRKKLHWSTTPYTGGFIPAQRRDSLWTHIHDKAQTDSVCISSESRRWMEKLFVKVVAKTKSVRRLRPSNNNCERMSTRQCSAGVLSPHSEGDECRPKSSNSVFFGDEGDEMEGEPDPEEEESEDEAPVPEPGSAFLNRRLYVVLLDHKKSQNIAIVLARVKRTFPEITHEIMTLNCHVLSSPALQSLIDMWPDSAEQEAIDQFDGDVSNLATAEQFLMVARKIPRVQQKLRCLQFKMDFAPRVKELRGNLKLMIRGVQQVCASETLAGVLEYVFHLGNLLNFGEGVEYTKWVKSISIGSLAKLSFTKAFDGRISFLQYVVQSIERDEPHLARFAEHLSLLSKCSKLSIQSLVAEQQSLKGGLRMLINETQKATIFKTDDVELRAELANCRESMRLYAMEVEQELNGLQELVNQMERERKHFLNYFEEEDTLPLDELLGSLASFADEYSRERQQLILRARRAQKSSLGRSVSVNLPHNRHSLLSTMPTSNSETVVRRYVHASCIYVAELCRPTAKNAFNDALYDQLSAALDEYEADDSLHAMILTGHGDYFTSGADVKETAAVLGDGTLRPPSKSPSCVFMHKMLDCKKLLVAAVNGPAIGIGVTLLMHCDVVFAADRATFWTPFLRIGVVPEFASSYTFPHLLGPSVAANLVLRSKVFTAKEALDVKIVGEVLPTEGFLNKVLEEIELLVTNRFNANSLPAYKSLLRRERAPKIREALFHEFEQLDRRAANGEFLATVLELKKHFKSKSVSKL